MAGTTRQLVFGMDPDLGITGFFTFPEVVDYNSDSKALTCAHVPWAKGAGIGPSQETVFLGTINVDKMYQSFRKDLSQDDGTDFEVDFITARIDPVVVDPSLIQTTRAKRFHAIEFPELDPLELGLGATVSIAKDSRNAGSSGPVWEPVTSSSGKSIKQIETGLANWIHVRIEVTGSSIGNKDILGSFIIRYYERPGRDREDN